MPEFAAMVEGIGIDLGTTTSEIAYYNPETSQKPSVIRITDADSCIVPSVVWFDNRPNNERIVVGKAALDSQILVPAQIVSSVKRQIGKASAELKDPVKGDPRLPLLFREQSYGPVEISAEILKYLASAAQDDMHAVNDIVVTVPAEFNVAQKEATVEAVRLAGLNLQMLLPEPVAALLAYEGLNRDSEQRVLVFDLGGGTLDCTIIGVAGQENTIMAKTGGLDIAGDRFDQIIFNEILHRLKQEQGIELDKQALSARQEILKQCRSLKVKLSDPKTRSATLEVRQVELEGKGKGTLSFRSEISRSEFDRLIEPVISTHETHIQRALQQAALHPSEVDRVLLVGGSTRVPAVRELVQRIFETKKVRCDLSPDLIVAQGAAIASHSIHLGEPVIYDTLMRDLGMQDSGSMRFIPIIPRGTSVRQAEDRRSALWPAQANSVALSLYEAEGGVLNIDDVGPEGPRCRYVGTWEIKPPQPLPPGQSYQVTVSCNPQTSLPQVDAESEGRPLPVIRHNQRLKLHGVEPEKQVKLDVVFIVDTTGSMRHSPVWRDLQRVLRNAYNYLDTLGSSLRAGLATFGDLRGNSFQCKDTFHLMELTPRGRDFLNYVSCLDNYHTEGGDDPESCLDALHKSGRAGLRSGDNGLRVFVLITDGSKPAPPVKPLNNDVVLQELVKKQIAVYCIGRIQVVSATASFVKNN